MTNILRNSSLVEVGKDDDNIINSLEVGEAKIGEGEGIQPPDQDDPHVVYANQLNDIMEQLATVTSDMCRSRIAFPTSTHLLYIPKFSDDPLLRDLPHQVSLKELQYLMEETQGNALHVTVRKKNGENLALVLSKKSTVSDLKYLIEHRTSVQEEPLIEPRKISWKYVWQTYHLVCNGIRLTDSALPLRAYGVEEGSIITYGRTLVIRDKGKRNRPRERQGM